LGEGSSTQPIGYCNADWGNDVEDRRSTSGIIFMLAGGQISWSTQKQGSIATSTCEAELNSLNEAAKQARYLRELLRELGLLEHKPTALFNDNQSALAAIKRSGGGEKHRLTKHIEIKLHGLLELVNLQTISVGYHPTGTMPADGLTKTKSV